MEKLQEKFADLKKEQEAKQVNAAWREHNRIIRGQYHDYNIYLHGNLIRSKTAKSFLLFFQNKLLPFISPYRMSECQLAVAKLFAALKREFEDLEVISETKGYEKGCLDSIRFRTAP